MISAFVGSALFLRVDDVSVLPKLTVAFQIWLAGSFAADVLIAITMLAILRGMRSRSTFRDTGDIITKISRHSVQTGALTALSALAQLVLFVRLPTTNLHQVFAYILGKLYSNSLLANLNARVSPSEQGTYLWNSNDRPSTYEMSRTNASQRTRTLQAASTDNTIRFDTHHISKSDVVESQNTTKVRSLSDDEIYEGKAFGPRRHQV